MKQIWAPWRKKYVMIKKRPTRCVFCRLRRAPSKKDVENLVVLRSVHSLMMLNLYPYNSGHLMIVPNRHLASLEKLRDEEKLDLLKLVDSGVAALKKGFRAQGFNVGLNLGRVGGAGIPGHLHFHVVPRWEGDTNFMPVIAGTKVVSDSLAGAYQTLRRVLKR